MKKFLFAIFFIFLATFANASNYKFKIIPLPFVYYSFEEIYGGFFLNIPGLFKNKSSITINGLFSQNTKHGSIKINFPAMDSRHPGFQTSFGYGQFRKKYSLHDYDNSSYFFFQKQGLEIEQAALANFFSNNLELKFSIGFQAYKVESIDFYYYGLGTWKYEEEDLAKLVGESGGDSALDYSKLGYFELGAKYKFQTLNQLFVSEKSILGKVMFGFQDAWEPVFAFNGQLKIQHPIIAEWFRFDGHISGYLQTTSSIFMARTGADVGLSILNPRYVFSKVMGISAGFEFAPIKLSFGVLSLFSSYQYARYGDNDNNSYPNYGAVFGVRVYKGQSSVQLGSASISYNDTKQKFYFHAGVALSL